MGKTKHIGRNDRITMTSVILIGVLLPLVYWAFFGIITKNPEWVVWGYMAVFIQSLYLGGLIYTIETILAEKRIIELEGGKI